MHRPTRAVAVLATSLVLTLPFVLHAVPALGQTPTVSSTILWTAPGDDGMVGRASRYDLRYSTNAISATDTLSWWNAATVFNMTGRVPAAAGAADSVVVSGLTGGTRYFFIIRAADEVPNWSGFSNVAIVDTNDAIAPIRISDLRAR